MITRAVPAAALLLALAACGSSQPAPTVPALSSAPSTTTAARATPTPTPPPTPTVLTVQQAGQLYLRLVAPTNRTTKALNAVMLQQSPDLADAQAAAAADAKTMRAFSLGLQHARWPVDVQPLVNSLVVDVTKIASYERAMATTTTLDELFSLWASDGQAADHGAPTADLIRQKLGLPPPPAT